MKRSLSLLIIIIIFLICAILIRTEVLISSIKTEIPQEGFTLPRYEIARVSSIGYSELIGDFYWLKAIQYFGEKRNHITEKLRHLYPLTNLITDISPLFEYAYRFGGITLSLLDTNGDLSEKILIKGIKNSGDSWKIPYLLGYVEYYVLHNPRLAAVYYNLAGQVAIRVGEIEMRWLLNLSEKLLYDVENTDIVIPVLERLYQEETDPVIKEKYFTKFREALRDRDLKYLQRKVDEFYARFKRYPEKLDELIENDLITLIPVEPFGMDYAVEDGRIIIIQK